MNKELEHIFSALTSEKHYVPNTISVLDKARNVLNVTAGQNANWTYANFFILDSDCPISDFSINEGQFVVAFRDGDWSIWDYNNSIVAKGLSDIETFVKKISDAETLRLNHLSGKNNDTTQFPLSTASSKIDEPLQVIYYGAPGTGKSFTIDYKTDDENSVRTTFHPDSDYASFVGAYKPTMENVPINSIYGESVQFATGKNGHPGTEKKIVYKYVPQAFLKAYVAAWSNLTKPYFLIIEEINRGNCAQIFGDLFQLLDRNNAGSSSYAIHADEDISQFLSSDNKGFAALSDEQKKAIASFVLEKDNGKTQAVGQDILDGKLLLLPPNLYIWATMNTSDQSLFPIDSAFKRRWEWKYVKIADSGLNYRIAVNSNEYDWWEFVKAINAKIGSDTDQEDKKLGYFFAKAKKNADGNFIISADTLLSKVLFFIYNDVYKDFGLEDAIFQDEDGETMNFADYFDEVGDTVHDKVERFLLNLGLEPLTDEQAEEAQDEAEIEEDQNDDGSSNKLTIRFPDGTVVKEPTRFESFKKALEIIGLDKVEPIAAEKKYMRRNSALVSTSESPEILADPVYTYVKSGDYYIVKGTNTRTQRNLLNLISDRLNLGLKVTAE